MLPVFLPHGYPHTVTSDYTPYQIYDSLQAFASSIAGLLSSRAVLQSLGFDSENSSATSTATYATLLSIAQATISNLSTILFAHRASSRIAAEVKYYRFLADIVNDVAFVLDCLSPSLPQILRVPALCLSSGFRAVCGVAGGSSKAVLSAHFAKDGNIGELNAKDGSQETVLNLVGMWVGGVVVSRVEGLRATWIWMLTLLGLHLWFNYCAVRSVRLRGLNGNRANMIMGELVTRGSCPTVEDIGKREGVFQTGGQLRGLGRSIVGNVSIGVSLATLMKHMDGELRVNTGSIGTVSELPHRLFGLFQKEQYILWFDARKHDLTVALKDKATVDDQLKAWCHAVRMSIMCSRVERYDDGTAITDLENTLRTNNTSWPTFRDLMEQAGWDMTSSMLETSPSIRLTCS